MPEERIGGGFTEGELKFASFWVRHGILLRKIGRWSLIGINILLWAYVLWGILDAYAISYPRESRITAEIAQNQFIASQFERNRPQNVQTGSVSVFQGTDGRMDFVVPVTNPNTEWWVEFTYRFNVSGEMTPSQSGFILPGQKTYLGAFGFKPATKGARSGALTVDNIRWHRTDPAVVGEDYAEWLSRREQFRMEEVTFLPSLPSATPGTPVPAPAPGTAANQRVGRTSFTFVNPSAYGFWNVRLYIVLKRASAPVAATTITLSNVQPGDRRLVEVDWFDQLPSITDTEIVASVNFLDESAYLPSTQTGR